MFSVDVRPADEARSFVSAERRAAFGEHKLQQSRGQLARALARPPAALIGARTDLAFASLASCMVN